MKIIKLLLSTVLVVLTLQNYSCSREIFIPNLLITGENGYNFFQSQKEWMKLKKRHRESYQFTVYEQSYAGFGSETTIMVMNGEVVSREYQSFSMDENDGTKEVIDHYYEGKEQLGMHSEGWEPVDLDEMYHDCGSEYLRVDPDSHTLYFDTNEEGVISLCGNVPDLCADDCFNGFTISKFEWLQ